MTKNNKIKKVSNKIKIVDKTLKNKFFIGQKVILNGKVAKVTSMSMHRLKGDNTDVLAYDILREDKSPDRDIEASIFKDMADYSKAVEKFERGELKRYLKKYPK